MELCVKCYDTSSASIMTIDGKHNLFTISIEAIASMLDIPRGTHTICLKRCYNHYKAWNLERRKVELGRLLKEPQHSMDLPPYKTKEFPIWIQETTYMFTLISGRDNDQTIDEPMLALMDWYMIRSTPFFKYADAIAQGIKQ